MLVYRAISQDPDRPGWSNSLLIFLMLSILTLTYYAGCVLNCGLENEPRDPVYMRKCFRQFIIIEHVLIALVLSCIGESLL